MGFSSGVLLPKTLVNHQAPLPETLESPVTLDSLTTSPVPYSGGITAKSMSPSHAHSVSSVSTPYKLRIPYNFGLVVIQRWNYYQVHEPFTCS